MANKSIDRRVALRLNLWQSGALGKLWGSANTERESEISRLLCHSSHCGPSFDAVRPSKSRFALQLLLSPFPHKQRVLGIENSTAQKKEVNHHLFWFLFRSGLFPWNYVHIVPIRQFSICFILLLSGKSYRA